MQWFAFDGQLEVVFTQFTVLVVRRTDPLLKAIVVDIAERTRTKARRDQRTGRRRLRTHSNVRVVGGGAVAHHCYDLGVVTAVAYPANRQIIIWLVFVGHRRQYHHSIDRWLITSGFGFSAGHHWWERVQNGCQSVLTSVWLCWQTVIGIDDTNDTDGSNGWVEGLWPERQCTTVINATYGKWLKCCHSGKQYALLYWLSRLR